MRNKTRRHALAAGFRSGFEKNFCEDLKKLNVKFEYETEKLNWIDPKVHVYTPDVIFDKLDGTKMYLELKGFLDAETKAKMKLVKLANPLADIRFVFMKPSTKISKGSKTTYGDWATKNGFLFCGPELDKKWLDIVKK